MKNLSIAKKKIEHVIANLSVDDPILFHTWSLVDNIPDKNQTTIGIDSRSLPPTIKYNPNFIARLSTELLEMILSSETFKLLLRHPTNRMQQLKDISGLASQIVVDEIVTKNFQNIPGVKDTFPMPSDFDLPENNFMEDDYRRLKHDIEETQKNISEMFGDGGPGETGDGSDSKDEDGNKEFKNTQEALQEYLNPRKSTCSQCWGGNDMLDAEIQNMVSNFKGTSKMWGKHSGDFVGQIVAANTPKISAREILRRFNTSVVSSKKISSRMKINRRFDLEQPGRKYLYTTKVLFAMDSSGSMSDEDIAEGCALVNSALKHTKVDYIFWDTEIHVVEKNVKNPKKEFKVGGRGGTSPEKVLQYAEENHYDGVVIFSDMIFSDDLKQPKTKVFWLGTEKSSKKPVSWGYFATLDRK